VTPEAKKPAWRIIVPVLLLIGAVWFGLQLGPREAERDASPEGAVVAAKRFVRTMLTKRGGLSRSREDGHNGPLRAEITFPAEGLLVHRDADDPNLWVVTGTAKAGDTDLQWLVRECWHGVRNWRAKAVEVVGPERKDE
jgi:hypothetical protein